MVRGRLNPRTAALPVLAYGVHSAPVSSGPRFAGCLRDLAGMTRSTPANDGFIRPRIHGSMLATLRVCLELSGGPSSNVCLRGLKKRIWLFPGPQRQRLSSGFRGAAHLARAFRGTQPKRLSSGFGGTRIWLELSDGPGPQRLSSRFRGARHLARAARGAEPLRLFLGLEWVLGFGLRGGRAAGSGRAIACGTRPVCCASGCVGTFPAGPLWSSGEAGR